MRLQELIRKAIQFGTTHRKELTLSGYDTYEKTVQDFFNKHEVKNCSIPFVVGQSEQLFCDCPEWKLPAYYEDKCMECGKLNKDKAKKLPTTDLCMKCTLK